MRAVMSITHFCFSVGNFKILFIRLRDITLYDVFKFSKGNPYFLYSEMS